MPKKKIQLENIRMAKIILDDKTYVLHVHDIVISPLDLEKLNRQESINIQCDSCSTWVSIKVGWK